MSPTTEATTFGSITIDGKTFKRDVLIRLSGKIKRRKKKLSSRKYGTSHKVSRKEAKHIYQKGARHLIIGTGQEDNVRLSKPARRFFEKRAVACILQPTPQAIQTYNTSKGPKIGMFHVTC